MTTVNKTETISPKLTDQNVKTITLDYPINRGDTSIDTITIKKPDVGALRGLKLKDIMDLDVDTMAELLPRISTPTIVKHEINNIDVADFVSMATVVIGFFANSAQKDQIKKAVS